MEKLLVSVNEGAERLSCSRSTIYLLLSNGLIRSVKLGRKRLIDVSSLVAFAASLPETPLSAPAMKGGK